MLCFQQIFPIGDTKRLKRIGPRTDPCGTPDFSVLLIEWQ